MAEQYIHFSSAPLGAIKSIAQEQKDGGEPFFKPRGFWFSVEGNDDGWKWWCEAEHFRTQDLARQTEIIFKPSAKILRLSSPKGIDDFTEKYVLDYPALRMRRGMVLDWAKVAAEYDAIVVAPYIWERRLSDHCFWYYTWDCASGCVWNAAAIEATRALPSELDRAVA